ncbi:MAG: hypothetical protein IPL41_02090 [Micropruina sp.]|nr:hypothetical protein [Micropruina sp.]
MFGLLPLETLPGWEEAANPTVIETLTILIGIPAAIFAVILLLGMAPSWLGRGDDQSVTRSND